ncbi:hypothetical protein BP6252_03927 [Coleophoma cylindrospora]|uniref:Glycosyltransferase family 8 protein n=1 Tax=Coleophoma cylindrospora TaxID=1849047 RepID=A0A3D8S8Y1_9HELO|nr:hypothetical protein BP6252_03927 [Coleophoma cylindrospora]
MVPEWNGFPKNKPPFYHPAIVFGRSVSSTRVAFLAALSLSVIYLVCFASSFGSPISLAEVSSLKRPEERLAYATYLAPTRPEPENDDDDNYFIACRMVAYQIMHAPETKTNRSIPFVVMVHHELRQSKKDRLKRDGAVIVEVEGIRPEEWMMSGMMEKYMDLYTKLRVFQWMQYDRVLFIDGDHLIVRRLDDIFDIPEATMTQQTHKNNSALLDGETGQPSEYLLAASGDLHSYNHPFPPPNIGAFNTGFFLFKPSIQLFEYYMTLMKLPNSHNPEYPEQALVNYAHRPEGNMPFAQFDWSWNIILPNGNDWKWENRAASFHEKWWRTRAVREVREELRVVKESMFAFYRGRDEASWY